MSKVKSYTVEVSEKNYADLSAHNEKIVETAGFIPLDVKFKRFEQAGIAMQFQHSEFTANDFRQLYANPDFEIYPDDELEDVQEKMRAYDEYRIKFIQEKQLGTSGTEVPSQQAERASVKEQETTKNEEVSSK